MKIIGARTFVITNEPGRRLGDANNPKGRTRNAQLILLLDTDEGITGVAPFWTPAAESYIHSFVDELLTGRDPRGVRGLWQLLVDHVFKGNNRGIVCDAIAVIDIALWDIKAKANSEPLWRTLGASVPRARAYASGIDSPLSDEELRAFYEEMAGFGIAAGKLKVGLNPESDLRRIGIMKEALATTGKRVELMIDSNEYWSPKQAIRYISMFEEQYDLTWVEEPARRWDYRGLRQVSRAVRAAVATGENLDHVSEYVPLITNEAVDVVESSTGSSGITGLLQVAELAAAFELPFAMMSAPGNYLAHVAAAIPNHIMMEIIEPEPPVGISADTKMEDGWIVIGNQPGLGLSVDESKIRAIDTDEEPGYRTALPWGRRRGAGLYLVGPEEPASLEDG